MKSVRIIEAAVLCLVSDWCTCQQSHWLVYGIQGYIVHVDGVIFHVSIAHYIIPYSLCSHGQYYVNTKSLPVSVHYLSGVCWLIWKPGLPSEQGLKWVCFCAHRPLGPDMRLYTSISCLLRDI